MVTTPIGISDVLRCTLCNQLVGEAVAVDGRHAMCAPDVQDALGSADPLAYWVLQDSGEADS